MPQLLITPAVALAKRPYREVDRVVMLYSRDLGKVRVRFRGVERPQAKLKAFAEPMTRAEYRLYLRGETALAAGGALQATHPRLRSDLRATALGLYFCEALLRITPERDPQPALYDLIAEALRVLDSGASVPWLALAYTLRLLQAAGFGLRSAGPGNGGSLWRDLHDAPPASLAALAWDPALHRDWWARASAHLDQALDQPVLSRAFLAQALAPGRDAVPGTSA